MLQIQQLTTTSSEYITCEQQNQIHGGSSTPEAEYLWSGYASGEYNVRKKSSRVVFSKRDEYPDDNGNYGSTNVGSINLNTGKPSVNSND
jgi:hypothetical protein